MTHAAATDMEGATVTLTLQRDACTASELAAGTVTYCLAGWADCDRIAVCVPSPALKIVKHRTGILSDAPITTILMRAGSDARIRAGKAA